MRIWKDLAKGTMSLRVTRNDATNSATDLRDCRKRRRKQFPPTSEKKKKKKLYCSNLENIPLTYQFGKPDFQFGIVDFFFSHLLAYAEKKIRGRKIRLSTKKKKKKGGGQGETARRQKTKKTPERRKMAVFQYLTFGI